MCVFETFDPWAPLRSMTTLPFMILSLSYFVSRPYGPEGVPELRSDSLDVVFFFFFFSSHFSDFRRRNRECCLRKAEMRGIIQKNHNADLISRVLFFTLLNKTNPPSISKSYRSRSSMTSPCASHVDDFMHY